MGLEFLGRGAGNEGWELRAGGQPSPMLQFGFFRPHHLLKLLGLTGLLPLLLQLEVQWKCLAHPRGAVSGGVPELTSPEQGPLLLSAAFGGPCPERGLTRVKSRFIFASVSYSSRSVA